MAKQTKKLTRVHWSEDDKHRAVVVFKTTGSSMKTEKLTGIPAPTIRQWKQEDWFKEKMNAIRIDDSINLESTYTELAKKSIEEAMERLTNGDHVVLKDGSIIRKPVGARDAAIIAGISSQQRKSLAEQQESTPGGTTTVDRLATLMEKMIRFAEAKNITPIEIEGKAERIIDDASSSL